MGVHAMREDDGRSDAAVRSAACPGGIARQFRVQVQDAHLPHGWRLVGSFRDAAAAAFCATRESNQGRVSRVIECRTLPTAA
jgi:hypothetical protein